MNSSIKQFTNIGRYLTSYSMDGIKANARIRVEQIVDLFLWKVKLQKLGQLHDEVLSTTEKRFKHHKAEEDRVILKN